MPALENNGVYAALARERLLSGWREKAEGYAKLVGGGHATIGDARKALDSEIEATVRLATEIAAALESKGGKVITSAIETLSIGRAGLDGADAGSIAEKVKILRELNDFRILRDIGEREIKNVAYAALSAYNSG